MHAPGFSFYRGRIDCKWIRVTNYLYSLRCSNLYDIVAASWKAGGNGPNKAASCSVNIWGHNHDHFKHLIVRNTLIQTNLGFSLGVTSLRGPNDFHILTRCISWASMWRVHCPGMVTGVFSLGNHVTLMLPRVYHVVHTLHVCHWWWTGMWQEMPAWM